MDGLSLHGVHINGLPKVEDLLTINTLVKDMDICRRKQYQRRRVQKYNKTVRLLRYNHHACFVSNNNAVFKSFRCLNCDTVIKKNSQFGAKLNYKQLTRGNCLSQERILNPRNSL